MVFELGAHTLADELESDKKIDKHRIDHLSKQLIAAIDEIHQGDGKKDQNEIYHFLEFQFFYLHKMKRE